MGTLEAGGPKEGPGTSSHLGDLSMEMPALSVATVVLLRVQGFKAGSGAIVSEHVYTFGVLPSGQALGDFQNVAPPLRALWSAPSVAVSLSLQRGNQGVTVATLRNPTAAPALYIQLKALTHGVSEHEQFHPAIFSDNYIVLF